MESLIKILIKINQLKSINPIPPRGLGGHNVPTLKFKS